MTNMKLRLSLGSLTATASRFRLKRIQAFRASHPRLFKWILIMLLIGIPVVYELRTSAFSSRILSSYASKMSYRMGPGPSPSIVFPEHGPFDVRTGYALIPDFERRLHSMGYKTTAQARFSPQLERAAKWGIRPPYAEPNSTKLTILGKDGESLFQAPVVAHYFNSFEEIPPLAVKSLVLIENRELDEPADDTTNPVVDWDRLAKAALLYAGNKLGLPLSVEGGSTLATQMEKYRHSYEGRTESILAKLRQMTDASLKVYHNGPDTREERRQIILDYLNSIPLAAAPGYGELHGIGNGLYAWFGLSLQDIQKSLLLQDNNPEKAKAFKHILALLCSVKAPSYYLIQNHEALQSRVNFYVRMLANTQVIPQDFARQVESTSLSFSNSPPKYYLPSYAERKAVNEIRSKIASLLGVPGLYELDRLHLEIESTIDPRLQHSVVRLFERLKNPQFVSAAGLRAERLLQNGDPSKIIYGMMLFEKTPRGNLLRVATDNLDAPFDINTGMKMQLGSTAKLRVLVNYMIIVASLHEQLSGMDAPELQHQMKIARDPITQWATETLSVDKKPDLDTFLQLALDRKYSASPGESFFTGGGLHHFNNFDKADNGRILTIREATKHSVNLAYIRLMRDLVRYYEARLPYDTKALLSDIDNPIRRKLLQGIADEESRHFLYQAYKAFNKRTSEVIISGLLGENAKSARHQAILFYALHKDAEEQALSQWLNKYLGNAALEQTGRLAKAYGNPRLTLADYGYLLDIHPLRLWCAKEMLREPQTSWKQIWEESVEARRLSDAWLFKTKNRSAQELRLKIRFEQDIFARMTPLWKRLGFPFDRLIPSLATAIGSSGDRPEALAQLIGILLNDGERMPTIQMTRMRFAGNTPYETTIEPIDSEGTRVLPRAVARAILPVLALVVQSGTAARLSGAMTINDRSLVIGGKTGSGDNRFDTVGRQGQKISSRPVDRTAVFVFYIEDRYFGVITAFVPGEQAGDYGFTSSLPVAILKLLAPAIEDLWLHPPTESPENPLHAAKPVALASKSSPALKQ
jgi:membrane peptidoglycan carboxypeptidase